jgi:microcystin-dependent protein
MDNILIYGTDINTNTINLIQPNLNNLSISDIPIGMITQFAGSSAPSEWLICDGTNISRSTYSLLFYIISTNYGSGDGITTFSLPDLCGRFPVGYKNDNTNFNILGKSEGNDVVILTNNNIPSHNHLLFRNELQFNSFLGGDTSKYPNVFNQHTFFGKIDNDSVQFGSTTSLSNIGTSSINGSGIGYENLPPYIVLNYIIYTGI